MSNVRNSRRLAFLLEMQVSRGHGGHGGHGENRASLDRLKGNGNGCYTCYKRKQMMVHLISNLTWNSRVSISFLNCRSFFSIAILKPSLAFISALRAAS